LHKNPAHKEFALSVGEEIRRVRLRRGLSQGRLAELANKLPGFEDLGLYRQSIGAIENGDCLLSFRQAIAICCVLGVNLSELAEAAS
jgi:DNA-binding XRE family transcriptional regulator